MASRYPMRSTRNANPVYVAPLPGHDDVEELPDTWLVDLFLARIDADMMHARARAESRPFMHHFKTYEEHVEEVYEWLNIHHALPARTSEHHRLRSEAYDDLLEDFSVYVWETERLYVGGQRDLGTDWTVHPRD